MPRRWQNESNGEVRGPLTDKDIFDTLTLCLVWPRSYPKFLTDHEISVELRKCWETERHYLPWLLTIPEDW